MVPARLDVLLLADLWSFGLRQMGDVGTQPGARPHGDDLSMSATGRTLDVHFTQATPAAHERFGDHRAIELFPILAAREWMNEFLDVGPPRPDLKVKIVLSIACCGLLSVALLYRTRRLAKRGPDRSCRFRSLRKSTSIGR